MTGVLNHARNGCNQSGQTETTAASCSHRGVRTRKCTTCGKTETQNTPANGVHHQGSWYSWSKLNETQHQRTRSCLECHKTETQTSNHSQGSQSNWQDHNETQHKRSHTCSTCNYTAWKYANHTYGDWIIDKAATCSAKGSKHKICSQCGHRVDAEIEIDPSAHDYQQKDCDIDSTCTNSSIFISGYKVSNIQIKASMI